MEKKLFSEMTLDELKDILSTTIKEDNTNKVLLFLVMLSAFTDHAQMNATLNGPSSSGKTYLTNRIVEYFPKDSCVVLSNATPTALFYGNSKVDKERGVRIVDLERKIFIILEQADPYFQANIRSLLSHDQKECIYMRTNKDAKGANKAEQIVLRGFPATIFCSANLHMDDQEATRMLLLSPEVSDSKILSAIDNTIHAQADSDAFRSHIDDDQRQADLRERINAIKNLSVQDILIPDPDKIMDRFLGMVGRPKSRHMRDVSHLMEVIKSITLLNIWHRNQGDRYVANDDDIEAAFAIWSEIVEIQELGINAYLYNFYKKVILPAFMEAAKDGRCWGLSRSEIVRFNNKVNGQPVTEIYLTRNVLPTLANAGLITYQKCPHRDSDKRVNYIFPMRGCGLKLDDGTELQDVR